MSVVRVEKTKNYTIMSNYHLQDKELSLKAKGLLSVMLSLPEDWNYTISGLSAILKDGERGVKTSLDELKKLKYLKVIKIKPTKECNEIRYEYVIYERPYQDIQYQGVQNVGLHSVGQINTNKEITKTKEKEKILKKENFTKPTEDEIKQYCEEKGYSNIDVEYFIDYYESNGWLVGRTKMKDWKATIRNWNRRNYNTSNTKKEELIEMEFNPNNGQWLKYKVINGKKEYI